MDNAVAALEDGFAILKNTLSELDLLLWGGSSGDATQLAEDPFAISTQSWMSPAREGPGAPGIRSVPPEEMSVGSYVGERRGLRGKKSAVLAYQFSEIASRS